MVMSGKRTIEYPAWVEQYRGKGATIRKVKNGYGLYRCTTRTLEDGTRKNIQEYLGMITEQEGFIPKRTSAYPERLEYGLSHVIWKNYAAELKRHIFAGGKEIARLAVIQFISGKVDGQSIRSCASIDRGGRQGAEGAHRKTGRHHRGVPEEKDTGSMGVPVTHLPAPWLLCSRHSRCYTKGQFS